MMILSLPPELLELVARYLRPKELQKVFKAGVYHLHNPRAHAVSWALTLSELLYVHKHLEVFRAYEFVSYKKELLANVDVVRYLSKLHLENNWSSRRKCLEHLETMLAFVCRAGNRECVSYLCGHHDFNEEMLACGYEHAGSVEIAELEEFHPITEASRLSLITNACKDGNLDVVKHIHDKYYKNRVDRDYVGCLIRKGIIFMHEEILVYLYNDIFHARFSDAYFKAEYENTLLISLTAYISYLVTAQDLPLLKKNLPRMPIALSAIPPEQACNLLFTLYSHNRNSEEKIEILVFLLDNGLNLCRTWPLSVFIDERLRERQYQPLLALAKRSPFSVKILRGSLSPQKYKKYAKDDPSPKVALMRYLETTEP